MAYVCVSEGEKVVMLRNGFRLCLKFYTILKK